MSLSVSFNIIHIIYSTEFYQRNIFNFKLVEFILFMKNMDMFHPSERGPPSNTSYFIIKPTKRYPEISNI